MTTFDLIPFDTCFFRDSKPLAAGSSYGRGARWPLPLTIHSAIRSALLSLSGLTPTEKKNGYERRGKSQGKIGTEAYNWLHIKGPFPVDRKEHRLFFPTPLDISWCIHQENNRSLKPSKLLRPLKQTEMFNLSECKSNLPNPLRYPVVSQDPPSKVRPPSFVSSEFYKYYLEDKLNEINSSECSGDKELWDSEYRIGIGINPETQTVEESKLFAAEHLRLREGIRLCFSINDPPFYKLQNPDESPIECLNQETITVGGEDRFFKVEKVKEPLLFPSLDVNDLKTTRLKWVLLSPAIFSQGWLPGWIDPQKQKENVLLRAIDKEKRRVFRKQRRSDREWKYDPSKDEAPPIKATLVAARIGKPIIIGGWEVLEKGPRPTLLAVPPGSVYYFETEKEEDTKSLFQALHERCRSDYYGEKGFGLGLCGTWDYFEFT